MFAAWSCLAWTLVAGSTEPTSGSKCLPMALEARNLALHFLLCELLELAHLGLCEVLSSGMDVETVEELLRECCIQEC